MSTFRKCTNGEIEKMENSYKMGDVLASADEISILLGEPMLGSGDAKTDVEWIAINSQQEFVALWNWKDGQWLGEEFDPAAFRHFSIWFSDQQAYDEFVYWLAIQRKS